MADADTLSQMNLDANIDIDTWLSEKARQAVDYYIHKAGPRRGPDSGRWPVKPTQIKGLLQVARQQPDRVKEFAQKQYDKASGRSHSSDASQVTDFWSLVLELVGGASHGFGWSLTKARQEAMPEHLRPVKQQDRVEWERTWNAAHVPAFFRSFCIYYLYRMYNDKEP